MFEDTQLVSGSPDVSSSRPGCKPRDPPTPPRGECCLMDTRKNHQEDSQAWADFCLSPCPHPQCLLRFSITCLHIDGGAGGGAAAPRVADPEGER